MKVLLVQPKTRPKSTLTYKGITMPPIGLMLIAGVIRDNGFEVKIADKNIYDDVVGIMKRYSPDIVGVTAFTAPMILDGIEVTKQAKEMFGENVTTVWGGIHPSLLPEQTLQNPYIDIVVIGEGEHTFLDMLTKINDKTPLISRKQQLRAVKGIGFKENGTITITEARPFIENLDALPLLPWDLVNAKRYLRYETCLYTSRGCPHRCAFCYGASFHKRRWRGMSAERVLEEINHAESFAPIKRLKFFDDNFTANKKRWHKVIENIPNDVPLYIETRVDYITNSFINKIKKMDDIMLLMGVESGSSEMLKKLRKDITVDQIKHAYELCNENNIKTSASFMIGLPGETKADVNETVKLVKAINPTKFTCCIFKPYPGSELYEDCIKNELFHPPETLEEWGYFSLALDDASINLSNTDSKYLNHTRKLMIYKTIWHYLKAGRFKDLHDKVFSHLDDLLTHIHIHR